MKILIIGGSGMIGSYLIKSCKNEGYDTEFTFYKNMKTEVLPSYQAAQTIKVREICII